ncbi:MAG: AAA family ATPase [Pontixanthobacter sp.]
MDRGRTDAISWGTIDRGLFPDPPIDAAVPVPEPSACPEPIDPRRGRSLIIKTLEEATAEGHTLLPQEWIVNRIRDAEFTPACSIGSDWFEAFAENLAPVLVIGEDASGSPAWQLDRYADTRALIGTRIRKRLSGIRHNADENWRVLIDKVIPVAAGADDAEEQAARNEKAVALEEVFRSRVSALIGPAGTGKTTLLQALLSIPAVKRGGVLLLAPTGKARVQMQKKAGDVKAFTLAQFLSEYERYDGKSFRYFMTGQPPRENGFATVIIDEASMLTEDQLAATLDALDAAAVQRLVLVGDPRQLPPIGAGRPFVDVITLLREADAKRVPGLAELSIVRRQTGGDGVLLSRWFSGEAPDPGADEVWDRLSSGHANGVRAIRWENDADLQKRLLAELSAHVRREADPSWSDETAFEVSLGGSEFKGRAYFRLSQEEGSQRVGGGASAENWQILSPLRGGEVGVDGLNRCIKSVFRTSVRNWTDPEVFYHRKAPKPLGAQAIEYGDKVINTANGSRRFGPEKSDRAYLANGEIGLAIGQFKGKAWPKHWGLPWQLQVEFSSQAGLRFQFEKWDFGEDGDARLELAYALTIHKSQGSEFGTTFVVIPNPCRLLSRELLYTALTRQQQEVIILYQGELRELMRMSDASRSDTAHRLTNLFAPPSLVEHGTKFLEQGLVHRTIRGELVRSKSEVIIANLLDSMGVPYSYEQPFVGLDGSIRYPDFTVEDAESGRRLLVEHLGMLDRPDYKSRWEKKLLWYRKMGVKPVEEGQAETGLLMTSEIDGFDAAKVKTEIEAALGS